MRATRLSMGLLAASALLAVLAAVLVESDIRHAQASARASMHAVPVVVSVQNIPSHTLLTATDLQIRLVPQGGRTNGALVTLRGKEGYVTAQNLYPGEQILPGMIVPASASSRMADRLPTGLLAIAIAYNPINDAGGSIQVGDTVAVLGVLSKEYTGNKKDESRIIASGVTVLSAPAQTGTVTTAGVTQPSATGAASAQGQTVTLAVTPAQADQIAFITVYGELSLLLEPSAGVVSNAHSPAITDSSALANP